MNADVAKRFEEVEGLILADIQKVWDSHQELVGVSMAYLKAVHATTSSDEAMKDLQSCLDNYRREAEMRRGEMQQIRDYIETLIKKQST